MIMKKLNNYLLTALTAADDAGRAILNVYKKHIEVHYNPFSGKVFAKCPFLSGLKRFE